MKGITMLIVGLILGIVLTLIVLAVALPRLMFLVDESKFDFDATALAIEKQTAEKGWSMPHQYDLQATLKKHGFEVKPVKVFSVCKPDIAYKILGANEERMASALMPCRLAVFQRNDGKTYVSRLNAGLFASFMGSNIKAAMKTASAENEDILKTILKK